MVKPRTLLLVASVLALTACGRLTPAPTTSSTPEPSSGTPEKELPRRAPPPESSAPSGEDERSPGTIRAEQAPDPDEPSPVDGLLEKGWRLHHQGRHDAALSVAERAQRIAPRDPEVYLLMARARFSRAQLSAAEQLVRRGLAFSPDGSRIRRQLQALLEEIISAR